MVPALLTGLILFLYITLPVQAGSISNVSDLLKSQRWIESEKNPVFILPADLDSITFPSVLYSTNRFGVKGSFYRIWFDTLKGLYSADSNDGLTWRNLKPAGKGLKNPIQGKILYDSKCFGQPPYNYRIWYIDSEKAPSGHVRTAWSKDGLEWTQDTASSGVYIKDHAWSRRGYGIVSILYHPDASPQINLKKPIKNRFVLFYECFILTGRGMCEIALAVSGDGESFTIIGDAPVLQCGHRNRELWDADYTTFGSIIEINGVLHAWYSGGRDQYVDLLFSGVGYAKSEDGIHWKKAKFNPVITLEKNKWYSGTCSMPQVIYDPERFAETEEKNGTSLKMFLCGSENNKFFKPGWRVGLGVFRLE